MAIKVAFSVEVLTRDQLEMVLSILEESLADFQRGERAFAITHEVKGLRGKTVIKENVAYEPGEPIDLADFGIPALTPLEQLLEESEGRRQSTGARAAVARLRPRPGEGPVEIRAGGRSVRLEPTA